MATATIAVSEAKNRFSSLIREVEQSGARFIVENRGRKVARIVPYEQEVSRGPYGLLSEYADSEKRAAEKGSAEKAVVKEYAASR